MDTNLQTPKLPRIKAWTRQPRLRGMWRSPIVFHRIAFTGACPWLRMDASAWYWKHAIIQAAPPLHHTILYLQTATNAIEQAFRSNGVNLCGVSLQSTDEMQEARAQAHLPRGQSRLYDRRLSARDTVVRDNALLLAKWPQLRSFGTFYEYSSQANGEC